MANAFIKLGSLDFDEIKSNLKSYMQNQSDLSIDFDGSIANTVLDLLAYNTMYYAFYSNMLINESFIQSAQRPESLISLVKPFGYSISHKKSATTNLSISTTGTQKVLTPYTTTFSAVGSNGIQYVYYYTGGADGEVVEPGENEVFNQVTIQADGNPVSIPVYQGKSAVVDIPVTVDYTNQKIELTNKNADIRTLRLYVIENDGVKRQYTRVDNVNSSLNSSSRVYYLETSNTGYTIYFGAPQGVDGTFTGRGVGTEESVFISYVNTSGAGGNGSTSWTTSYVGLSIQNPNIIASGGTSSPNVNEIKFMAPREFASASRLVTVSDYQKAILDLGKINTNSSYPDRNVSVYGKDQSAERTTGTAYFSLYDNITGTVAGTNSKVTDIISELSDQVLVGTTFQYKDPTEATITLNLNSTDSADYDRFASLYSRGFNQKINQNESSAWSSARAEITAPLTDRKFDLKNPIKTYSGTDVSGATFTVLYSDTTPTDKTATITGSGVVDITANDDSGTTIGTVDTNTGLIALDSSKITSLYGISAEYASNLTEIKIQHELLGNPVAS